MAERRWGMCGWNEDNFQYVTTIGDVDVRIMRRFDDVWVGLQWTKTRWGAYPVEEMIGGSRIGFRRSRVSQHVKDAVMALIAMEKSHG